MTCLGCPNHGRRLVLAWMPFSATVLATRGGVRAWERDCVRAVNQLPDALGVPAWTVMQGGALASPLVAAGVARVAGRSRLAVRLAASGLASYALAKAVKRFAGRGRPGTLLEGVRIRGRPASGGGFVSGHAAVSMALACEAYRSFGPSTLSMPLLVAPVIGLARIYVGAHLPLDVLGGAALGFATSASLAELYPPADRALTSL